MRDLPLRLPEQYKGNEGAPVWTWRTAQQRNCLSGIGHERAHRSPRIDRLRVVVCGVPLLLHCHERLGELDDLIWEAPVLGLLAPWACSVVHVPFLNSWTDVSVWRDIVDDVSRTVLETIGVLGFTMQGPDGARCRPALGQRRRCSRGLAHLMQPRVS